MTHRKADHGSLARGTQPLSRSTSLRLPSPAAVPVPPAPKPDAAKPMAQADANAATARKLDLPRAGSAIDVKRQALSDKKLQLAQLHLSVNAKLAEAEAKKEATAKQPLWKRALEGLVDAVADGINGFIAKAKEEISDLGAQIERLEAEIAEAIETGGEILRAGIQEYEESRTEGQSLLESLKDSATVVGKKTYNDVIDPLLDRSVLGADDEYQDQAVGALGPILTNRLSIGESVSIRIDAGTTIPLEEFGIPNAKIDAGATLKVTRIAKHDANGEVITEPKDANGNPPTELKVTMELEGRAGASYAAKVGFDATAKAGRYEAGLKATAGAEAEAGLHGRVAFAFTFDPNESQDMDALTGMLQMSGGEDAESAIPGLSGALATKKQPEMKDLIAALGEHLYSIDGEGGLYGQATAYASAKAGIFKSNGAKGSEAEAPAAEAPKTFTGKLTEKGKDYALGKVQDKAEEIESSLLDELQLSLGSVSAAVGGEVSLGGGYNHQTGERTVTMRVNGKGQAALNVLGAGASLGASGDYMVSLTYDRDGSLKGVKLQSELTKEQFEGIRTTVEDVFGRPMDAGAIAQLRKSDTVRVTYDLVPSEVERIAELLASNPVAGMAYVATLPIGKETVAFSDRSVLAIQRHSAEFKFGFNISLGADLGIRGGVTLAHEQETALTN